MGRTSWLWDWLSNVASNKGEGVLTEVDETVVFFAGGHELLE